MFTEMFLTYSNLSQKQINEEFVQSCQYGCLKHIKYLLTSKELPYNAEIDYEDNKGLVLACFYNQTEVIKYLLSSSEISHHADINVRRDVAFKLLCNAKNYEILTFLIHDLDLQQSEYIKEYLIDHPEVNSIFLSKELSQEIIFSSNKQKITKI